jgi:hypothetical protein
MEDEQPINRGGRPRKLLPTEETLKTLGGLGRIQCTTKECAAWFNVSEPTFLKFIEDFPEARATYEEGKGQGLTSLRRSQFRLAEKNAAMAIFLGKNYLGQTDKQEHEHMGRGGGPIQTVDLSKVSDADLDRLEAILSGASDAGRDPSGEGEATD